MGTTMNTAGGFGPLRNLRDIEDLERVPLEQRLLSWDVNDWIRAGLELDPQKVAIRYVADGNPESPVVNVTYGELKQRATSTANLFHSLGVGPDDAVLYLMPTIPALYTVMLGALATGIACCTNWMLEPSHWAGLIRASRAKVVVALGPTPGYEIWEKLQSVRADLPPGLRILSVQMPGGCAASGLRCRGPRRQSSPRTGLSSRARPSPMTSPLTFIPAAPPDRPSSCG